MSHRSRSVTVTDLLRNIGKLGLIWRSMPDLGPSFEKFARGLKERAEHGA
ncbi:MAG TPA: hypothetical protein VFI54_17025 [Solirubrobacteraceae bacterium]|nr:hypothetical protein [Solirubrobacteraceae bacterium]